MYNKGMKDEQAEEIIANLKDYFENPEDYSIYDLEEIFQDRDPFEFLWWTILANALAVANRGMITNTLAFAQNAKPMKSTTNKCP